MTMPSWLVVQNALDALGEALVDHDHVWTSRERWYYERAIAWTYREQQAAVDQASAEYVAQWEAVEA